MEEDQACLFGDVALGLFCPRILIVSTPNYEYNVILQGSNLATPEEDLDEKAQTQTCKFRNHDHKFEWTREQFNHWATRLAQKYNYSVEFGGVGGKYGTEPGFASQIAVFRKDQHEPVKEDTAVLTQIQNHYRTVWEWDATATIASSKQYSSWMQLLKLRVYYCTLIGVPCLLVGYLFYSVILPKCLTLDLAWVYKLTPRIGVM